MSAFVEVVGPGPVACGTVSGVAASPGDESAIQPSAKGLTAGDGAAAAVVTVAVSAAAAAVVAAAVVAAASAATLSSEPTMGKTYA